MKKMLILTLILGMTSVAGAGIVVVGTNGNTAGAVQTDPIGDVVEQQALFMGVAGLGSISNETLIYPGNLAALTDYTGLDADLTAGVDALIADYAIANPDFSNGGSTKIVFLEYFDGTAPPGTPPPVSGVLTTFDVTGTVEVYLMDPLLGGVVSAAIIPEPITLSLLGLGGLFLRRRK